MAAKTQRSPASASLSMCLLLPRQNKNGRRLLRRATATPTSAMPSASDGCGSFNCMSALNDGDT